MLVSVLGSGMMSGMVARVYGVGQWGMDWGTYFAPFCPESWLTGVVAAIGLNLK